MSFLCRRLAVEEGAEQFEAEGAVVGQALGAADEEDAAGSEGLEEASVDALLGLVREVDDDVAAEDQVIRGEGVGRTEKVVRAEKHTGAQMRSRLEHVT